MMLEANEPNESRKSRKEVANLSDLSNRNSRGLLCFEVNPPRGTDLTRTFKRLDRAGVAGLDFLNVTDSALARMKCNALVFGSRLKERYGREVLVNFACRDRNSIAIQSDLLGAGLLGVESVVALTGDAVSLGDHPDAKSVFEFNSLGLLKAVAALNQGEDLQGAALKGSTKIVPGVVTNPNAKNHRAELRRLASKQELGARYALSQPVFDQENTLQFLESASAIDIPIMLGLMPVKSKRSAEAICSIPGIKVPKLFIERVESFSDDQSVAEYSLDFCCELAELSKDMVVGFHVISGATPTLSLSLVGRLAEQVAGIRSFLES